MAGWTQLLHDIVERRLSPTGATHLGTGRATDLVAPSWDTMFDDALAVVMQHMLADRLDRLTPEQFVTIYRCVHGDSALLVQLDRLVQSRAHLAERDQRILRLSDDARIAGRLRLDELEPDETLDIGLFDPTQPHLAAWRFRDNAEKRPLHRVLRVRTTSPAAGGVHVIADTWTGAVWGQDWRTPLMQPMSAARIGTRLAGSTELRAEITLRAPVSIVLDDGTAMTPPQIAGYVRTLDGRLLLDAPDQPS